MRLFKICYLSALMTVFSLSTCSVVFAEDTQKMSMQTKSEESFMESEKVNINTATVDELAKGLHGIGINKAKKIVEYRETFGSFLTIEQLREVSGIGQSILDKNIEIITL